MWQLLKITVAVNYGSELNTQKMGRIGTRGCRVGVKKQEVISHMVLLFLT